MTTGSVAERLRRRMDELTPQERRAARTLLADYPRAGLGTSAELAAAAGVSAPTVVRFARSLGFGGFAELQSALMAELTDRASGPTARFSRTGTATRNGHWLSEGAAWVAEEVRGSLAAIPPSEFDAAVALLADPKRRITCVGGRYSNVAAQYLAFHLQQLRPNVGYQTAADPFGPAYTIDADRLDVCALFDVRRYQRTTVDLARRLKDRGATLIVITDPWLTPAAGVADIVLPTSVSSQSPFDSLATAFVLTELLVGAVLEAVGETGATRLREWDEATDYEMLP